MSTDLHVLNHASVPPRRAPPTFLFLGWDKPIVPPTPTHALTHHTHYSRAPRTSIAVMRVACSAKHRRVLCGITSLPRAQLGWGECARGSLIPRCTPLPTRGSQRSGSTLDVRHHQGECCFCRTEISQPSHALLMNGSACCDTHLSSRLSSLSTT